MEDVVKEFLLESHENLDQLDRDFVELEKHPTKETLGSIFRVIHTIKGTCGFLGFAKLESITHAGEGLLALLREGRMQINARITDSLLAMVDAVREVLASIESTGKEGGSDYSSLVEALGALQKSGGSSDFPAPPIPLGEILVAQGRIRAEDLDRALKQQASGDTRRIGEILVAQGSVTQTEIIQALQAQKELKSAVFESSVRVDLALLDKLVNLVGELVLCRNQIQRCATTQEAPAFLAALQHLNLVTAELQEGVMKTRMQPIAHVWSKFPRLVRDLAASCGKQVRIEMEGLETKLDRTVIEAIRDPLTHIVRNAVDHGIEPPEVRKSAGKTPEGRLLIRAYYGSGQVHIEITDDGAGVNPERVAAKALRRGLLTREQAAAMNENELIKLIFLPGLSTADKITHLSGRGVGMEVVRTGIEKIGGTVEVQSSVGQGTRLKIKLPLTLAVIPALMVTMGGNDYAIPQASLLELVRLEGDHSARRIEMVHDVPVYRLRNHLLPLVFLDRELQLAEERKRGSGADVNIVVLQADKRQFGLVVDGIRDSKDIVVKPLGKHLKSLRVFSGATILGDGRVALILDVDGIAHRFRVVTEARKNVPPESVAQNQQAAGERERLLICHCGRNKESRVGIPLSMVDRLEEFPLSSIERSKGREVVQYRGEVMPLIRLSRALGEVDEDASQQSIQVVVYREHGRSVGLVVARIAEIVEQPLKIEPPVSGRCLVGSAVVQGHVTDVVNVRAVIESVEPGLLAQPEAA